jgi:hypothetical protein
MKWLIKGLLVYITIAPFLIGYLCYTISWDCFMNYLWFGVPMILVRIVHMLILLPMKEDKYHSAIQGTRYDDYTEI